MPDDHERPDSSLDRIRAERRQRELDEPGVRTGLSLGSSIRRTSLVLLPFELALLPVMVTLLGWWLDRRNGWFPLLTIIGLCLGLGSAARAVVRAVREVQR
jgi:F0F1-type ATP synthase assembly protein I